MKNYIIAFLGVSFIFWLGGSVAAGTFTVFKWPDQTRQVTAFFYVFVVLIVFVIAISDKPKPRH